MAHPAHHHATHTADQHGHTHAGQAEILDLDADVTAGHLALITAALPITASPRHIVDLGCGTGAGTLALLDQFPSTHVTAVDSSPAHLHRLLQKAQAGGVAARVTLVQADLDAPTWPSLGTPELVWASASMHHMKDPSQALHHVHDMLAAGGLFAVVELASFPRFLPATAPQDRPGLEDRCHAALEHRDTEHVSHRGADWGSLLTAAGFTVGNEQTITINIGASADNTVGQYALASLARVRASAAHLLLAADLAALDQLLDTRSPHSILRRSDLAMRTERTIWAARRT